MWTSYIRLAVQSGSRVELSPLIFVSSCYLLIVCWTVAEERVYKISSFLCFPLSCLSPYTVCLLSETHLAQSFWSKVSLNGPLTVSNVWNESANGSMHYVTDWWLCVSCSQKGDCLPAMRQPNPETLTWVIQVGFMLLWHAVMQMQVLLMVPHKESSPVQLVDG